MNTSLVAPLALLLLSAAGAARAEIWQGTFSGTITQASGAQAIDVGGAFGAAGGDLTGDSFTGTFRYDPAEFPFNAAYSASDSGYGAYGTGTTPTPSFVLTLTIDGVTRSIGGSADPVDAQIIFFPYDSTEDGLFLGLGANNTNGLGDVDPIITRTISAGDQTVTPTFNWTSADLDTSGLTSDIQFPTEGIQSDPTTFLDLPLSTFTIGSAVPEPASWTIMLLGVGLAGGRLRDRRAVAARGRSASLTPRAADRG